MDKKEPGPDEKMEEDYHDVYGEEAEGEGGEEGEGQDDNSDSTSDYYLVTPFTKSALRL